MTEAALALSLLALAAALHRTARLRSSLASERLERLSSSEASRAQLELLSGRLDAIEQRVGRAGRLTPAKRTRALELLAHGASHPAIACQLEMRETEVALLARLHNNAAAAATAD